MACAARVAGPAALTDYASMSSIPRAKRIFDIITSLTLLVGTSPIAILCIISICVEGLLVKRAGGPVFYSEERITADTIFILYKFRIFTTSALSHALVNQGRINTKRLEENSHTLTRTGWLLKQISADELPQLYNVLRGDMSMVGPRPTNVQNYRRYVEKGGRAKKIQRAGLTGYFQSHKGLVLKLNQEEIDMRYAHFCATSPGWRVVLYDAYILLLSIFTVLRAEGI